MNALSYLHDFINLFFPELCPACNNNLFKNENIICTDCIYHFPYTNFQSDDQNPVIRQLWGRFSFIHADAFLYFYKGGKVQNMMHQLKYNNHPQVGFRLGELYGNSLLTNQSWIAPDVILPVPLHPRKLRKRGYNQSEYIAKGISHATKIPVETNVLKRKTDTDSQTTKSRYLRYENMAEAFEIENRDRITGKHLLLVDDVITTGATFEGCSTALLNVENTQVSLCALAFAE